MILLKILFLLSLSSFAQIDPQATLETRLLYKRLDKIGRSISDSEQKVLIGQQNAFYEGRGWRLSNKDIGKELRSDMKTSVGIHPAVVGFDFSEIGPWNEELVIWQIKQIHERGGVITLSWHAPAFVKGRFGNNSSFDVSSRVVKHILPGGKAHKDFLKELNRMSSFFHRLKDVPIIFRPWHEHNFFWFWWGAPFCTKSQYIGLWRFTVDYLRSQSVHNLLYAYSPISIGDYFFRYPGDEYVDILGVDHYLRGKFSDRFLYSFTSPLKDWRKTVIKLSQAAVERNKIAAVTEFGLESAWYENFWTKYFAYPLEKDGMEELLGKGKAPQKGPAFILLWRNDPTMPKHYFGPIPGHKNNPNFIEMLTNGLFLGLGEIKR
jgi:mannan endo-1,4-beta-mannosidase